MKLPFLFRNLQKTSLEGMPDDELIRQYFAKREEALASELFNRYTHLVFGVCMKYLRNSEDAKDAVMQIFEEFLLADEPVGIRNFSAWLFTVSKNHCLMKLRSKKPDLQSDEKKMLKLEREIMEMPLVMHHYDEEEYDMTINKLQRALDQLNHAQKVCVELFYLQDKQYREISDLTGYDLPAVKSYIQNGKRNLKIILQDEK
jgi:RNA polymerase sigma-70 factor (ECF subfamily)